RIVVIALFEGCVGTVSGRIDGGTFGIAGGPVVRARISWPGHRLEAQSRERPHASVGNAQLRRAGCRKGAPLDAHRDRGGPCPGKSSVSLQLRLEASGLDLAGSK